jgi:hypothetical protein
MSTANERRRAKALTAVAGEYYVAAELSRCGYLASITFRNAEGVDVLCTNADASKSVAIQVKSASGMARKWRLRRKGEELQADTLFYVFVNISNDLHRPPDFTVVPGNPLLLDPLQASLAWPVAAAAGSTEH